MGFRKSILLPPLERSKEIRTEAWVQVTLPEHFATPTGSSTTCWPLTTAIALPSALPSREGKEATGNSNFTLHSLWPAFTAPYNHCVLLSLPPHPCTPYPKLIINSGSFLPSLPPDPCFITQAQQ